MWFIAKARRNIGDQRLPALFLCHASLTIPAIWSIPSGREDIRGLPCLLASYGDCNGTGHLTHALGVRRPHRVSHSFSQSWQRQHYGDRDSTNSSSRLVSALEIQTSCSWKRYFVWSTRCAPRYQYTSSLVYATK